VRRYFRKAGCKTVTLPGLPGSDEFMAAYSAALAAMPKAQATKAGEGSMTALIGAYYKADALQRRWRPRRNGCAVTFSTISATVTAQSR
jgi:hypothetical protein